MSQTDIQGSPLVTRYPGNPVLSAADVPYHATLVLNAGVTRWRDRYVMLFRNDYGDAEAKTLAGMNLGLAFSDDGLKWTVEPEPIFTDESHPLYGAYDPRLTILDGRCYLCFATQHRGTRGGVAVTDDLESWEVLSVSVPDNRNMAIFPERFDGEIVRLERPFAGYPRPGDKFDIWLSRSPDGRHWGESQLVLKTDDLHWVNNKIGPGAPPIKTDRGWLALIHAVDIDPERKWGWYANWTKRYVIGLMLLALEDPAKVIGLCREPVMVPEPAYVYEMEGYRDHVQFPCGAILEDDGTVRIYYGASDTVVALATAKLEDLLDLCEPV